jgi:hypothetical protein
LRGRVNEFCSAIGNATVDAEPGTAPEGVHAATARGIQRTVADGVMRKSVTSPTLRKTVTPTTRSAPHFAR